MSFEIYPDYLRHISKYIETHTDSYTELSDLKHLSVLEYIREDIYECVQDESYVYEGLATYCIYNEIIRLENIDSVNFYKDECDVNIDDDQVKQLFKSVCDVSFYLQEHSNLLQEYRQLHELIKSKYNSTLKSHILITSEDYYKFIDFTNKLLFNEELNIQIYFPKYNSELKYKLDKFGCYEILEKMMILHDSLDNHDQHSLSNFDKFLEEYYFDRN